MAKRLYIRISDEVSEKINTWSDKLGVTASQLGGMAATSGIDTILRAVSPADSITPEKWAEIITAMIKSGKPIELPDGTIVGSEGENA